MMGVPSTGGDGNFTPTAYARSGVSGSFGSQVDTYSQQSVAEMVSNDGWADQYGAAMAFQLSSRINSYAARP